MQRLVVVHARVYDVIFHLLKAAGPPVSRLSPKRDRVSFARDDTKLFARVDIVFIEAVPFAERRTVHVGLVEAVFHYKVRLRLFGDDGVQQQRDEEGGADHYTFGVDRRCMGDVL